MAGILSLLAVLVLSFLAAAIPAAVYAAIVWWLARYKKAPLWLLTLAFFWGAVPAVIVSLVAELLFDLPINALLSGFAAEVVGASVVAPVVEEVAKALSLLLLVAFFRRYFDDVLDGISFGAFTGLGFAASEDFVYFIGAFLGGGVTGWSATVLMRKIIFGLNHAFFTSISGAAFGQARLSRAWPLRLGWIGGGVLLAIGFHAFHNLSTSFATLLCWPLLLGFLADWFGILATVVLIVFILRRERKWIVDELDEEVHRGGLIPDEYYVASSSWKRLKARWRALRGPGWQAYRRLGRFYQWLTELAFKKHQLRVLGDDRSTALQIDRLRARISQVRREMGLLSPASSPTETGPPTVVAPLAGAGSLAGISGTVFVDRERFRVGRLQGDLVIPHPQVSRRHAEIWRVGTAYRLADLNSTNGTRLNGKPVKESWLQDGDLVSFGPVSYAFRLQTLAPAEAQAAALPARPASRPLGHLTFVSGSQFGREVALDREVTVIGRQKGDLIIDDPFVSRQHAEIWRSGESYYIADLKSKNGTIVNGEVLSTPQLLRNGDTLSVGGTTLNFELRAA